jgi:hypothetical protein
LVALEPNVGSANKESLKPWPKMVIEIKNIEIISKMLRLTSPD